METLSVPASKTTKILFFDIETAPNLGWVWGKWEQNVIDVEQNWYILAFAAKWLDGKTTVKALPDFSGYKKDKENDKRLVEAIWKLFDEADIIVAHNGDQFDIKKVNARFSYHKLPPPSPYKTVDTKKVAKRYFGFISNKLNDLCKELELGQKIETGGFELWQGCMKGDMACWRKMKLYNKYDVVLLERIYLRFLPWMAGHPNVGMYAGKIVCPKCGSDKIQSRGQGVNKTTRYKRFQCVNCGSWGRDAKSIKLGFNPLVSI